MTIAVTGATGFVGQALLDRAAKSGIAVRALTRREQPVREGVEWVRGDLDDRSAVCVAAPKRSSMSPAWSMRPTPKGSSAAMLSAP